MTHTVRSIFMCSFLLMCWGCAQKSAKLQRSVVPPDQTLFETGTGFLEKGQYIRSRLALQTMINTYPDSEMTADAYFAIGDSYYEEGSTQNLLQAEQQYKDFIIFFPDHPKAPDAQMKIVSTNMNMMGAPDRDQQYTLNAEREALKFLEDYPNHDFVPIVKNHLILIRDKLAQKEEGIGDQYAHLGNHGAAIARYQTALNYENYNNTPEVLFKLAEENEKANRPEEAEKWLARIVAEYPDSDYNESAKERLTAMGKPIPEVNAELAALRKAKMRPRDGFSPLTPFADFVKALGFIGPPDRYKEAKDSIEAKKAEEAAKAAKEKAAEDAKKPGGIDIEDTIKK